MNYRDIVFEFLKSTLTGVTVNTDNCTLEDVVGSAFEAAELAADVFVERYGDADVFVERYGDEVRGEVTDTAVGTG